MIYYNICVMTRCEDLLFFGDVPTAVNAMLDNAAQHDIVRAAVPVGRCTASGPGRMKLANGHGAARSGHADGRSVVHEALLAAWHQTKLDVKQCRDHIWDTPRSCQPERVSDCSTTGISVK